MGRRRVAERKGSKLTKVIIEPTLRGTISDSIATRRNRGVNRFGLIKREVWFEIGLERRVTNALARARRVVLLNADLELLNGLSELGQDLQGDYGVFSLSSSGFSFFVCSCLRNSLLLLQQEQLFVTNIAY